MSRVAALLRRRAARLPEDSLVRAELMETAEYYATGADQASTGRLVGWRERGEPDRGLIGRLGQSD